MEGGVGRHLNLVSSCGRLECSSTEQTPRINGNDGTEVPTRASHNCPSHPSMDKVSMSLKVRGGGYTMQ